MYGIISLIIIVASFLVDDKTLTIPMLEVAALFAIADAVLSLKPRKKSIDIKRDTYTDSRLPE